MRGAKYRIVSKLRKNNQIRAHHGSELPSPRLATLACSAVAGRSSPVLSPQVPWVPLNFLPNRGYAAPVFASRYRSLATPWLVAAPPLPNIRRPASRGSEFRFIALPGKRKEKPLKGEKEH